MLDISIFSLFYYVFYPFEKEFLLLSYIYVVVWNAFSLDQSKIMSFGKELNPHFHKALLKFLFLSCV